MPGTLTVAVIILAAVALGGFLFSRQKRGVASKAPVADVMNISGDLIPEIDAELDALLKRGERERVMILQGTESGDGRRPYAISHIRIDFDNERDLRNCVRLLRWSDDRLRARPDQLILWEWTRTFREKMEIHFGVAWYDQPFFERRRDAFKEPGHAAYYAMFGASPDRFHIRHEILGDERAPAQA